MKNLIVFLVILCFAPTIKAQSNWQRMQDMKGVEFKMPPNMIMADTLLTTLYAAEIDSVSAVQVTITDSMQFDITDPLYNEALMTENGDTLRAIARIMLLVTDGEATYINNVYTNGIKGLELGIKYEILQNPTSFYSWVRYYLVDGRFFAFIYTETQPRNPAIRLFFFNSVKFGYFIY